MSDYLPFLVIGITVGSIYGIAAMGLVLTYKTSGVLNVGHGAVAAMAAVCFHQLRQEHGMPWPLAAAISILGFGIVAGLLMEQLARSLAHVPTSQKLVATVGLVVAIPALAGSPTCCATCAVSSRTTRAIVASGSASPARTPPT